MNRNCTVVIEQKEGGKIRQTIFSFDDYRVATAISNLLCNINEVRMMTSEYKEG